MYKRQHQEGSIVVDGTELTEETKNIEQIRAEVGMVFQQFNLFPHLSILDNCTLAPIWVKKMTKKEIKFRDPVVERVVDKFVSRSDVGYKKYKQTLDEERRTGVKDLADYLNDVQEELMDAILYIQAAREEIAEAKDKVYGNSVNGLPYYVSDIAS